MPPLYSRFSHLLLLSDRGGSSFSFISSCAFLARLFQNSPIRCNRHVRFSNRPFRVKHFQTIRRSSVDVAHGLALLFGIGTKALPPWDSRTRWNNLYRGLAVKRTAGPSGHANSPHPSSREGHHSTARWSSSFLLLDDPEAFHAAAAACSRVQRNSVPSTHIMVWTGRAPTE